MGDKVDENRDFFNFKVGLVLAGGGAKGAYETGVFKALWELDLVKYINVISGTSIGAVNALLLAMNDENTCNSSWSNLSYSRFIFSQEKTRKKKVAELLARVKNISNDQGIIEQLRGGDIALLSQTGVEKFIDEYVDMSIIRNSGKIIYACAYNIDDERPEYFCLNNYSEEEIKNIILASCAIPYIFKPINFKNKRYSDGGINSHPRLKHNADNVPITPLLNHECDLIIVVHLSYKNTIKRIDIENKNIIEIYPSTSLEFINGIGTINMQKSTLYQNIELGYRDAMVILAPMVIDLLKGESLEKTLSKNIYKNRILLKNNLMLSRR